MNQNICPNCRQSNPPGQPFCSSCGQQLSFASAPTNFAQPPQTPDGFQNHPPMNQPSFNQPPNNFGAPIQQANKKSPIRIIVAVFMVFAGLAAICGGIAKLSGGKSGQKYTAVQPSTYPVGSSESSKIIGKWRAARYGDLNFGANGRYTETLNNKVLSRSYEFNGLILRLKPDTQSNFADATATINGMTLTINGTDGTPLIYTKFN
jgi:hypothetical protein